jgi:hypothetical protein
MRAGESETPDELDEEIAQLTIHEAWRVVAEIYRHWQEGTIRSAWRILASTIVMVRHDHLAKPLRRRGA